MWHGMGCCSQLQALHALALKCPDHKAPVQHPCVHSTLQHSLSLFNVALPGWQQTTNEVVVWSGLVKGHCCSKACSLSECSGLFVSDCQNKLGVNGV